MASPVWNDMYEAKTLHAATEAIGAWQLVPPFCRGVLSQRDAPKHSGDRNVWGDGG